MKTCGCSAWRATTGAHTREALAKQHRHATFGKQQRRAPSRGMAPFKSYFQGVSVPPHPRLTSCQRCLRVGGKHNDLSCVGQTSRHHTFFEMLGNFALQDYDKRHTMTLAWTYLVNSLKLPTDRLRITVYKEDTESAQLWQEVTGWSNSLCSDRIVPLGKEDNYWSMGDEQGPAGPCTEIYWDRGSSTQGERWLEIWNLVFMTEQTINGQKQPLPKMCVDTGMGLERIASVLQGVNTNYDIDTFEPTIQAAKQLIRQQQKTNKQQKQNTDTLIRQPTAEQLAFIDKWSGSCTDPLSTSFTVLLDHLRSISFLYVDGLLPSNQGRGYVLRRLVRRALTHAYQLGINSPCLYTLYPALVSSMGDVYPELRTRQQQVVALMKEEEQLFFVTMERGLRVLQDEMKKQEKRPQCSAPVLNGESVFLLYDRYGFPVDLTELIVSARGWSVDLEGFNSLMQQQKHQSRAHWAGSGDDTVPTEILRWQSAGIQNSFTGYTNTAEPTSTVVAVAAPATSADSTKHTYVAIDPCPFYPTGGGQVSDQGWLILGAEQDKLAVHSSTKVSDHLVVIQVVGDVTTSLPVGTTVRAVVDSRRHQTAVHHTATHLLHAALRQHLATENQAVAQAGSFVSADYLRFDFSYPNAISADLLSRIEHTVNQSALSSLPVESSHMSKQQAEAAGALALFTDKYGDAVRVISVPGISIELCGGTHTDNTRQCYPFCITAETSVAAGIRRIEAVSGQACTTMLLSVWEEQRSMSRRLKVGINEVETAVNTLSTQLDNKNAEIKQMRKRLLGKKGWPVLTGAVSSASSSPSIVFVHLVPVADATDFSSVLPDVLALQQAEAHAAHLCLCPDNGMCWIAADPRNTSVNALHVWERLKTGLLQLGGVGGKGGGNASLVQGILPQFGERHDHALLEHVKQLLFQSQAEQAGHGAKLVHSGAS